MSGTTTRGQLELAVVAYVAWFNNDRLHEALGDIPPVEFEQLYARRFELDVTASPTTALYARTDLGRLRRHTYLDNQETN